MATHPLRREEERARVLLGSRIVVMAGIAVAGLLVLLAQSVRLQVVEHEHYSTRSQENRIRIRPLPPPRGLIRDRNGLILARNASLFSLEIVPEEAGDLDRVLRELRGIVPIGEEEETKFREQLGLFAAFESIPLRIGLDPREVAAFSVNRHDFPGVDIHARLVREYPYGAAMTHLLGYVGRIDSKEKERLAGDPDYAGSRYIGKAGVEKAWERELHGRAGAEQIEVDAHGRTVREVDADAPVSGADVYLGLDADLQLAAHAALAGQEGAVVAVDPRNGDLLVFASAPSFDPNPLVRGMDRESYRKLRESPYLPLLNRALRGQYPPGSVIKPFLGFAGLDRELALPSGKVLCAGRFRLGGTNYVYRDWKPEGHGLVDLEAALAQSCDIFFYRLALELGIERMHYYLTRFGLGAPTGVDLPWESAGLIPSPEWKQRARNQRWTRGETVITGIGQGYMLTTPMQLAAATATLSRRGVRLRPRAVVRLEDNGERRELPIDALPAVDTGRPEHWTRVVDGMEAVVHGERGTARHVGRGISYRIAGKTGTAQVVSRPRNVDRIDPETVARERRDHALFVGFAPIGDPRIAVAVVVEHGGSGSKAAAPIARAIIERYLGSGGVRPPSREPAAAAAAAGSG